MSTTAENTPRGKHARADRERLAEQREQQHYGTHVNPFRLDKALEVCEAPLLDVGCSSGGYVRALRERSVEAFGVDLLYPAHVSEWTGGAFAVASADALPFRDLSFGTLTAFEVLEHLPDPRGALVEMARVARRNLVVSVPDATRHPEHEPSGFTFHHYVDRTHTNFFTADSLGKLIESAGLRVDQLQPIKPVTPEILLLAQYGLPAWIERQLLRVLRRLPGRRGRTMTLLAVAGKPDSP